MPTGTGSLVTVMHTSTGYQLPTEDVIKRHIYQNDNEYSALRNLACRKEVYVVQAGDFQEDSWLFGSYSTISSRYIRVYLFGGTDLPRNTIPDVLGCDVSHAENALKDAIDRLNEKGHCMISDGLAGYINDTFIAVEDKVRKGVPGKTIRYRKGHKESLVLHERDRYK